MVVNTGLRTTNRIAIVAIAGLLFGAAVSRAEGPAAVGSRRFSIELYYRGSVEQDRQYLKAVHEELKDRAGVRLIDYDIETLASAAPRLAKIAPYFKADPSVVPALYGCNQYHNSWANEGLIRRDVRAMLKMDIYGRAGCPHCAAAKRYLPQLQKNYPGLEIEFHDIIKDSNAAAEMRSVAARYRQGATSVPMFHFCGR